MKSTRFCFGALAWLLLAVPVAQADLQLPKVFGDNMVLQRDRPVAVWGTTDAGDEVDVQFAGQEKKTKADADGKWQVALDPLKASATPQELSITATPTSTDASKPVSPSVAKLKNILVGEVWLLGGQSNMEYSVNNPSSSAPSALPTDPLLADEIKTETYPQIRLFRVQKQTKTPEIVTDGWTDCSGKALDAFSALGFYFGRNLQRSLNVPVGLVESCWGGSRLEQWVPPEAFTSHSAFAKEAAASGRLLIDGRAPGDYYKSMIRDLAPFSVRGVLWYQGESNIIASNDGIRYADKMQVLVDFWRSIWKDPNLPFLQVQIAPFLYTLRNQDFLADHSALVVHGPDELPKLWEAQFLATRIPGVGIVPTTDLDSNFRNIHPSGKREVGRRITNLALSSVYGQTAPASQGPLFDKWEARGTQAIVHFSNTGGQLATRDKQPPDNFEIAGADGVFQPATATISDDTTIILENKNVPAPTAVRLGWTETAQPNLVNKDGLPAYPFRTNGPDWKPAP